MIPEMQVLRGMGVSGGIAIGRAVCIETRGPDVYRIPLAEDKIEEEVSRLHEGARHARHERVHLRIGGQRHEGIRLRCSRRAERLFLQRVATVRVEAVPPRQFAALRIAIQ